MQVGSFCHEDDELNLLQLSQLKASHPLLLVRRLVLTYVYARLIFTGAS